MSFQMTFDVPSCLIESVEQEFPTPDAELALAV